MTTRAFTLVEILVVLAIIGTLIGIALPAYGVIREGSRKRSTSQLVSSIAAAMASATGGTTIQIPGGAVRRRWDFNSDQWLDGDPQRDDRFSAGDRTAAAAAAYPGTATLLGTSIPKNNLDGQGRIIDGWGRTLRIEFSQELYGKSGFGLWSLGKDGIDQTGSGDDLASWKQQP